MTPVHLNNAVEHYSHLIEQGKRHDEAIDHTVQRFGVNRDLLIDRIAGQVAHSRETREALAEARAYLTGEKFYEYDDAEEIADVLRRVYNAITGEGL